MTTDELRPIHAWNPLQHDPDDVVCTTDFDGIPGAVGRPIAEAAWALSVGVVELHQYAGFSGGHKGVSVGCGGRQTLLELHSRKRVMRPGVGLGQTENNPFRAAVDALGRAANCRLALVYVPSAKVWVAGPPEQVVREAGRLCQPWSWVDRMWPGAVLRVPPSKGISLYQASRAATYLALSPRPPVAAGGLLVLDAACEEGLGSEAGFVDALERGGPPWAELLTGPPPTGPGAQRAVMLALMARRYRIRVMGCQAASELRRVMSIICPIKSINGSIELQELREGNSSLTFKSRWAPYSPNDWVLQVRMG